MREGVLAIAVVFVAAFSTGCKKQVPNDIVQQSLRGALHTHSPKTTSAMCGTTVRGIIGTTVTVKSKNADNIGVAQVRGIPVGGYKAPTFCEGDIEFKFSSTTKNSNYRRGTKTTTWYLDHVKLLAVTTPGVRGITVDEDPDGDDDND
jgi:hypothetical protein